MFTLYDHMIPLRHPGMSGRLYIGGSGEYVGWAGPDDALRSWCQGKVSPQECYVYVCAVMFYVYTYQFSEC